MQRQLCWAASLTAAISQISRVQQAFEKHFANFPNVLRSEIVKRFSSILLCVE
jgi:hypothetical protein